MLINVLHSAILRPDPFSIMELADETIVCTRLWIEKVGEAKAPAAYENFTSLLKQLPVNIHRAGLNNSLNMLHTKANATKVIRGQYPIAHQAVLMALYFQLFSWPTFQNTLVELAQDIDATSGLFNASQSLRDVTGRLTALARLFDEAEAHYHLLTVQLFDSAQRLKRASDNAGYLEVLEGELHL